MVAQISPRIEIDSQINRFSQEIGQLDHIISQYDVYIARNQMDIIRFWTVVRDVIHVKLHVVKELLDQKRSLTEKDFIVANDKVAAEVQKIRQTASAIFMVLLKQRDSYINEASELIPLDFHKRGVLHNRFMEKVNNSITTYTNAYPLNEQTSLKQMQAALCQEFETRQRCREDLIKQSYQLIENKEKEQERIRPQIAHLFKQRRELFKQGMKVDNLCLAAQVGDLAFIQNTSSKSKSELNQFYNGFTPAHYAAFNGQLEALKLLFSYGAPLDLPDNNNDLPIHWAAKEGHLPIIQYLIEAKTKGIFFKESDPTIVNRKGAYGRTPLHRAVFNRRYEAVELLLEKGSDCRMGAKLESGEDEQGETPIHTAIRINDGDMIRLMGESSKTFDVMVGDANGLSALYHAVRWASKEIVAYMVQHSSFYKLSNDEDSNSLSQLILLAEADQRHDVVEILEKAPFVEIEL